MKVIVAGGKRDLSRAAITVLAAVILVAGIAGVSAIWSGSTASAEGTAVMADGSDDFVVSAALGALGKLGAHSNTEAIEVWAEGVVSRNGLMQYSVMSSELGERYLEILGDDVMIEPTAASVDGWYASEIIEGESDTKATLLFTVSENGESVAASAELTLTEEGEFTVISSLTVESPLYDFTGIRA